MVGTPHVLVPYDAIRVICRKHHIRKLSLFGSVLRDDFGPESDIDLLVEFDEGHIPGFFRLHEIAEELSRAFGGKTIDLLTPQDLSRYFRDDVVAAAEVCYAEADG
ncbi:nucleotidyltransferase family protein [Methanofollis ethanolicus]|uniref:nucleotidyltransferase family protein n=1 Tax=Methanofollis ethanolicus TaxID=488124 RepID=UPI0008343E4F|nr:nucleotidyltransferase family protein [Methanofollis ethanolicus]